MMFRLILYTLFIIVFVMLFRNVILKYYKKYTKAYGNVKSDVATALDIDESDDENAVQGSA